MERPIKIVLIILLAVAVINLITVLFGNSSLRDLKNDIRKAQLTTDSVIVNIKESQSRLDSIQRDVDLFKLYIGNIQKTVALDDAQKRLREEKNTKKIADLKGSINELKKELETDSLPEITVDNLKKSQ